MKIQPDKNYQEHQKFFANSFFILNEGISALGVALAKVDHLSSQMVIPLQKALTEATLVSYLIEKSTDLTDLDSTIKQIYAGNLYNTVENIKSYGNQFNVHEQDSDKEVSELIADNTDYFNEDQSLKFSSFNISTEHAANYVVENSTIPQVKNAFKTVPGLNTFFNSIHINNGVKNPENPIINLLNTLTVILVAFGYIEPFFQKKEKTSDEFDRLIKGIAELQTSIKASM